MNVTAEEFKKNPRRVYRAADKGEIVTVNHDHYQDKVFQLTARDRQPLADTEESELNNVWKGNLNQKFSNFHAGELSYKGPSIYNTIKELSFLEEPLRFISLTKAQYSDLRDQAGGLPEHAQSLVLFGVQIEVEG
jgi:hypothetical protein